MSYNFDNNIPIYIQLQDLLRLDIISKRLKPSERLLSVRELSLNMKVNPNTMQKALLELEKEGLIYTERTNGKFVTENEELIESVRIKIAKEKAASYLSDMQNIGIGKEDAIKYLQELGGNNNGTVRM